MSEPIWGKGPQVLESLEVPPWQIADTNYDNRVERDPRKQSQLVESIRSVGILVRLMVVRDGDHFRIVDGQSRLNAARSLNLATLPVDVIAADDAQAMLTGIIANNVREGNTAYEIMQAALKLVQEKKLGAGAIAKTLGVSEGYVKDLLAISGLPERCHEMLHSGALGVPAAKQVLRLDNPVEQIKMALDFAERRTSGPQAESVMSSYIMYREKMKNQPPEAAMELAQHDPLFTCELCTENKPIRGSQGRVYCSDCNRELMFLWETARRQHKDTQHNYQLTGAGDGGITYTVQQSPHEQPQEQSTQQPIE